jgi:hypothetical protein
MLMAPLDRGRFGGLGTVRVCVFSFFCGCGRWVSVWSWRIIASRGWAPQALFPKVSDQVSGWQTFPEHMKAPTVVGCTNCFYWLQTHALLPPMFSGGLGCPATPFDEFRDHLCPRRVSAVRTEPQHVDSVNRLLACAPKFHPTHPLHTTPIPHSTTPPAMHAQFLAIKRRNDLLTCCFL